MAVLITIAQLREHTETDLGDDALQRIIDDADAAIVARFGEHAEAGVFSADDPLVEQHEGGGQYVFPHRKVDTIDSVLEYIGYLGGDEVEYELAADDYRLTHDSASMLRLATGTNARSRWGRVVLSYFPVTDISRRTRVELDLCKLALQYSALGSEKAGDYSQSQLGDYQTERERLLSEMGGFVFA